MAESTKQIRYLYTVHDPKEGLEPFCFRGPVRLSRRLPGKRIPYRSLTLPSIQDQDGFFTDTTAPISASAQWVDHPEATDC